MLTGRLRNSRSHSANHNPLGRPRLVRLTGGPIQAATWKRRALFIQVTVITRIARQMEHLSLSVDDELEPTVGDQLWTSISRSADATPPTTDSKQTSVAARPGRNHLS